jgi:hypothetical protein
MERKMPAIGRVFEENKGVMGGSQEYTSTIEVNESVAEETWRAVLGRNDSLDIVFDNDMILDDLTVRNVGSSVNFRLQLLFPSGGKLILSPAGSDFYMNQPSAPNNWYRMPKWTRLRVSITEESEDGVLLVSVVGRA